MARSRTPLSAQLEAAHVAYQELEQRSTARIADLEALLSGSTELIAELETRLEKARVAYLAQRNEIRSLQAIASTAPKRGHRPAYAATPSPERAAAHAAYVAAQSAARELAMRTGKSVLVGES